MRLECGGLAQLSTISLLCRGGWHMTSDAEIESAFMQKVIFVVCINLVLFEGHEVSLYLSSNFDDVKRKHIVVDI